MQVKNLLCIFIVLVLALMMGDVSASVLKNRLTAKSNTLAKNKAYTNAEKALMRGNMAFI